GGYDPGRNAEAAPEARCFSARGERHPACSDGQGTDSSCPSASHRECSPVLSTRICYFSGGKAGRLPSSHRSDRPRSRHRPCRAALRFRQVLSRAAKPLITEGYGHGPRNRQSHHGGAQRRNYARQYSGTGRVLYSLASYRIIEFASCCIVGCFGRRTSKDSSTTGFFAPPTNYLLMPMIRSKRIRAHIPESGYLSGGCLFL